MGFLELALGSGDLGWCRDSWSGGNCRIAGLVVARLATLEWESRHFGEDSGEGLATDGADRLHIGSSGKNGGT